MGGQRIGTDGRAHEIAIRLDHLRRELSPSPGDLGLALNANNEFIFEELWPRTAISTPR